MKSKKLAPKKSRAQVLRENLERKAQEDRVRKNFEILWVGKVIDSNCVTTAVNADKQFKDEKQKRDFYFDLLVKTFGLKYVEDEFLPTYDECSCNCTCTHCNCTVLNPEA